MNNTKSEQELRSEWHEYFIKNKDKFTDSLEEVAKDKTKILVRADKRWAKMNGDNIMKTLKQETG